MPYADPVKAKEYWKAYNQRDDVKAKKLKYSLEWIKRNYEKKKKYQQEYYDANKEKIRPLLRERARKYRKEHPERVKETQRKRLKEREAYIKEYRQRDYAKVNQREICSKRRALLIRTSKFELNNYGNILKLFKLSNKKAKETGRDYHIDHIVPLQGRLVSGFHISGNLRVVLGHTNLNKHNHYTARDEALIQRRMVKDWIANGVDFKLYKPKKRKPSAKRNQRKT